MGFVQNRVAGDRSSPPSLYGADGVEAPVSASARWHDRVDVAALKQLGRAGDASWGESFDAMIRSVQKFGWVSPDGRRVRCHLRTS